MTILITGVAGLLGSNFSSYLLNKGYDVVGIDDLSGGYSDFVDSRVTFYKEDLVDHDVVDRIFDEERPDYVYHFAAYAAEGLSHYIRRFNYTNNLVCSVNVINSCIKYDVTKIIFTSSMAVYGNNESPYTETMRPQPEDPYGIAKYAVEQDLFVAHKHFGLDYNIIRPHNVVGVNQNIWDRYRNVIGIWIRKVINNEPISIFGDGTQIRAFSDINYYMEPFEKIMDSDSGEIYNLGADKYYTILDVANIVRDTGIVLGYSPEIVFLEKRNEVHTAYCSHDKAKKDLEFSDNTNMNQMVVDMFEWALAQPSRVVIDMDYEIEKDLYSYWR